MSSNLKVNTILPSAGSNIGLGTNGGNLNVDGGCKVQVGTALTLGHTVGVQFATQNLHSTGFEVNNVNASGIITASQFKGDGSNLTGISAGTSLSGSTNNTVCTVTGANAIQGEANLLFDGGTLALNGRYQRGSATVQDGDAIAGGLNINGTDMDSSLIMSVFGNDGDFTRISGSKSRNASVGSHTIVQNNDVLLSLKGFGSDGTNFEEAAQIEMQVDGTPNNNVMPGRIVFKTTTTDGVAERLRIDSTGWMGAGQTSRDHAGQVAAFKNTSNANSWLSVNVNNNTGVGGIVFGDSDTWAPAYIQYNHTDNVMQFIGNANERLRIASNGDFGFNDTAPTAHASGNNTVLSIKGKGSSYSGKIDFKDSDGNIDSYINSDNSILQFYADPNSQNGNTLMRFYVHGAERFRFGAAGQFGIGTNYGTAGQVLKSGGASAAPTWGSAGGETTEIYAYISFGTTYDTNSGYVTQDVSSLQSGNGITVDNSNERLTPTVAGKYFVMYMCNWLWSFSGGATFYNRITKNGSEQQRSTFSKYDPGSHTNITMCVMTMNGSSDYVQFQGYENKSGQAAYMGNLSRAVMFKLRD